MSQNSLDMVAKGIFPISEKIDLYGKLGVAYLTTQGNSDLNPKLNLTQHDWAPEVALGASYNITPNTFLDASWTHIHPMGGGSAEKVDFAAIGVGYSFG